MDLPKKIKDELYDYCRLNDILNIEEFILKMVKQGFTVEKFGGSPTIKEKIVEKVVEIEKLVEVKVEVPVEKIIEKEIYVADDKQVSILTEKMNENNLEYLKTFKSFEEKIKKLEGELSDKDKVIDKLKKELEKSKKDFYGE